MRSDKPAAKAFQDWVTRVVLPAIRSGGYIMGEEKVHDGELNEDEFLLKAFDILKRKVDRLTTENKVLTEEYEQVTVAEFVASNHVYLSHRDKSRLARHATMLALFEGTKLREVAAPGHHRIRRHHQHRGQRLPPRHPGPGCDRASAVQGPHSAPSRGLNATPPTPKDTHHMNLEATLPLLSAAALPGAVLVLGDKNLGRWFKTRPAVIDASPDSETPGASLWVGSRHLVVYAIKRGLFECCAIGKHLTSYRLTREGRSLWRDMADMAQHLQARVRDLTADEEAYATIDLTVEAGVDLVPATLEVPEGVSLQGSVLVTLRDAKGGWVSSDLLLACGAAARGEAVSQSDPR